MVGANPAQLEAIMLELAGPATPAPAVPAAAVATYSHFPQRSPVVFDKGNLANAFKKLRYANSKPLQ